MKRPRINAQSSGKAAAYPCSSDSILRLKDSARRGELVIIFGTGVSMGLTNGQFPALSWKGLIRDGFAHGVTKGKITAAQAKAWETQIESNDLDDLLGAAEFMGRKLEAPHGGLYARWLENAFKLVQPENKKLETAIRALQAASVPFCTLNYDHLLECVAELPAIYLSETNKVTAWMRRESPGIFHIHGSWDAPATCILGIRDYETTLGNDMRDLIQRSLASFSRLLFIGCGDTFADPNFSALIKWLRGKMKTAAPQHYALVKDGEMAARHADPTWHGFVEPLSYGASHDDLSVFLLKHFPAPASAVAKGKGTASLDNIPVGDHARLLRDYCAFLVKDCGQMTIEGVRADMDTAQRRFDLERLFVPLKVLPCPPEIPESDPKREQKLLKWQEKNKEPLPFGKIFAKNKRLALLALPGGGKTLLLKRLAVAYADPTRRRASTDALLNLDITPVLIRCREWREHIHRPILTLLQNISAITGQACLAGLSDALIPLLKKGRILLLVDGLDEIHDDALRSTFVEHLEAFLDEYKLIRLVVTSREAGFSLVAPCLARFCERWRVAPLQPDAITLLCDHWHLLMKGESPEAQVEGREVAQHLLRNASLFRLAENPLLLTMLLVVKHGAGRLPPDRVSLYSRAVEVLLDTWNIKGHDPLNPKEAVPQLACLAFHLLRAKKQTATEKELLALLEEAREKVPQIRRYAKDTPYEFLKRVELRSSLLLEAGRQRDGIGTVPFYQFRHLTFQEYLAAVAAVEGHYMEYEKSDTALTPLTPYLTTEEWKEVIPMAAVLARKQAEPIISALVAEGTKLRVKLEAGEDFQGKTEWEELYPARLPAPVARLVQCLREEAEAAPETLTAALKTVAVFAGHGLSDDDRKALCRGPYGEELLHQMWLLYVSMQWEEDRWLLSTCQDLAASRQPEAYWASKEGEAELQRLLNSENEEQVARGLFTCGGLMLNRQGIVGAHCGIVANLDQHLTRLLFEDRPTLCAAAESAWTLLQILGKPASQPTAAVLDRLLMLWLTDAKTIVVEWAAIALWSQVGLARSAWSPVLTEPQLEQVRRAADSTKKQPFPNYPAVASLVVSFHARNVFSEEELAKRLFAAARKNYAIPQDKRFVQAVKRMIENLGKVGRKYLALKKRTRRRK